MPPRKTPTDYQRLAEEHGFKWLGPEVHLVSDKTTWACSQGHQWETTYTSIRNGHGCHKCAVNAMRNTPQDYVNLAQKWGYKWLGPEVPNNESKTRWQCPQGHQWEAGYTTINHRSGCPHCANVFPKVADDYHQLAESKGFQWVGELPRSVREKTKWVCQNGHVLFASFDAVNHNGCHQCARNFPKTPNDYYQLAKSRNFEWLGPLVANAKVKTTWRCQDGHEWQTTYSKIRSGTGCPECARLAKKYHHFQAFKPETESVELDQNN